MAFLAAGRADDPQGGGVHVSLSGPDKSTWPHKPDVQAWEGWPARQPSLLFAGLAFDEPKYLALWQKLPADPANEEVRRNIAITQPLIWVK